MPSQSLPQCMPYSNVLMYSAPDSRKATFSPHRKRIGRHYEGILTTKLKRAERRGSQHTVPNGEGKKIQLGLVEWSKKNRAHAITVRVGDIWQLQVKDTWFALEASK